MKKEMKRKEEFRFARNVYAFNKFFLSITLHTRVATQSHFANYDLQRFSVTFCDLRDF